MYELCLRVISWHHAIAAERFHDPDLGGRFQVHSHFSCFGRVELLNLANFTRCSRLHNARCRHTRYSTAAMQSPIVGNCLQ